MSPGTLKKVGQWIAGDDTGLSSKFLCGVALGHQSPEVNFPHDPADFGRCYRFVLLLSESEVWELFTRVSVISEEWNRIVKNWDQLVELYKEECVGEQWTAPKLYQLMKDLKL